VLYGYETWSLTLRKEHRLRDFEISVEEDVDLKEKKMDHGEKIFGFHKESRLFFNKLSTYQLFKKYPALWSMY
jgi:hypothetical protein